jgi:dihydroorotate dehydrogenase (NAD+) catalytic subunit
MKHLSDAGAVVTKSIGPKERDGYGNPSVVKLQSGLINAMGLPNPGIESYLEELSNNSVDILIGSIFGKNEDEFVQVAKSMATVTQAIEMNMSCPHAKSYGEGVPTDRIADLVAAVKKAISLPVFVKLGSENLISRAHKAIEGGADGIVAINTIKAMVVDVETGMPVLANKIGGYSGPAIKPIGVRCVYELASVFDIPIIGVGGIMNARDVLEYMMAGASAVQIGSALHYCGKTVFSEIAHDISDWLLTNKYNDIKDIVGRAI